jgi:hypothetical protein
MILPSFSFSRQTILQLGQENTKETKVTQNYIALMFGSIQIVIIKQKYKIIFIMSQVTLILIIGSRLEPFAKRNCF